MAGQICFLELGIPYDSEEALTLAEKVMKTINDEAVAETQELAKRLEELSQCLRNQFTKFQTS